MISSPNHAALFVPTYFFQLSTFLTFDLNLIVKVNGSIEFLHISCTVDVHARIKTLYLTDL